MPVVGVNFNDAQAFASWAGKRLPTEAEWEKAARGTEGNLYPWGSEFDANRVVFDTDRTQPVNRSGVEKGASPFGVLDMAGNVWEWTSSIFGKIDLSDPQSPVFPSSGKNKVLRGGSWRDNCTVSLQMQSTYRYCNPPEIQDNFIGLRVAEDLK